MGSRHDMLTILSARFPRAGVRLKHAAEADVAGSSKLLTAQSLVAQAANEANITSRHDQMSRPLE